MLEKLLKKCQEAEEEFDTPQATQEEMEQHFEARTKRHISLVQAAIDKIVRTGDPSKNRAEWKDFDENELIARGKVHDASKFEEPERTPYISLTWRHKLEDQSGEFDPINNKGYQTPGMLSKDDENKATLIHITKNSHHPEYSDPEKANIDPKDRDKSKKVFDASKMKPIDIAEMIADWQAMAEELKKNTAREWFDKQKHVRWKFTPEQEDLIDRLLKVFETREPMHSLDMHDGIGEDDGW